MKKNKIPKKIHYCWFGKAEKPELAIKCIESWKKILPDYEIIEWNEENFDINFNEYVKEAYEEKKYAFVSDIARLHIIYNYGGIYLDTDVEVIKSFDSLLNYDAFFGFENPKRVSTGLGFGAAPKNKVIKAMLDEYKGVHFKLEFGLDLTPCPIRNTKPLTELNLRLDDTMQVLDGNIAVFPMEYFSPKDWETGILNITENTYSIHHFNASWHSKKEQKEEEKRKKYIEKYGKTMGMQKYERRLKRKKILNYFSYPIKAIRHPKKGFAKIKRILKHEI